MTVKSRKKRIFDAGNASDEEGIAGAFSIEKSPFSPSQEPEKAHRKQGAYESRDYREVKNER